jgi:WD40 repeat protein
LDNEGFASPGTRHADVPLLIKNVLDEQDEVKVLDVGCCMDFDISSDGKQLLACSQSGYVGIWDMESGFLTDRLQGMYHGEAYHQQVAFSPDGRLAATAFNDGVVRVWKVAQPNEKPERSVFKDFAHAGATSRDALVSFSGQTNHATTLKFFPDSNLLAVAAGNSIRLLDVRRRQERISLPTPSITQKVAISEDGKTLFALQANGSVVYFRTDPTHCNWEKSAEWKLKATRVIADWLTKKIGEHEPASAGRGEGYEASMALLALAIQNKTGGYQSLRSDILDHYRDSVYPKTCERILRASVLLPAVDNDLENVKTLIDRCSSPSDDSDVWTAANVKISVALAQCQQGRYQDALDKLDNLPFREGGPDRTYQIFLLADAVKALATHHLGNHDKAKELIDTCTETIADRQPFIDQAFTKRWYQTALPKLLIDEISSKTDSAEAPVIESLSTDSNQ